jgi:hypothetical protein
MSLRRIMASILISVNDISLGRSSIHRREKIFSQRETKKRLSYFCLG